MRVSISELVYLSGKQSKRKEMMIFILIITHLCFFSGKVEETCISSISYDRFVYVSKDINTTIGLDHFVIFPIFDSNIKTTLRPRKDFLGFC